MVREEGVSSLARGVGPNVFRAILMNASQLASYDFFKAELLKTPYFEDNIACHFTASFAAVSNSFSLPFASGVCLCGEMLHVC
jgi:solute carrier family 25 (mitochondrial dicarboxylate transporter), member 10